MVSPSVKGLANAGKILAINIEYVKRSGVGKRDKLVDRVEMRKSPEGLYTLHRT